MRQEHIWMAYMIMGFRVCLGAGGPGQSHLSLSGLHTGDATATGHAVACMRAAQGMHYQS